MKIAPPHPHEQQRLQALQKTNLLDSLSEEEFNSLTLIASSICAAPIALITLVDEKHVWFKSKVGLSATETSRDYAFCSHAILQSDVFIVENCATDERFKNNPLVLQEPHVVFYAGATILDPTTALPLGSICVIDHQARTLNDNQKKTLSALAKQVSKLIELKQKIREVEEQNQTFKVYATAIDNMQEGLVVNDSSGRVTGYNPAALRILGLTAEQIMGNEIADPAWEAVHPDGTPFPPQEFPAMMTLKTGIAQTGVVLGQKFPSCKDRWISINSSPIFLHDSKQPSYVISTFSDITALQFAQDKLHESARLVSLAQMASGIAHEINNPLSVIHAVCSLAQKIAERKPFNEAELKVKLQKIDETVFRISKIVKGLKIFSREGSKEELTNVSLSEVIQDTMSLCSERFRQNLIPIQLPTIEDHHMVKANFIQLGQVLLNLMNNAFDAALKYPDKWVKVDVETQESLIKIRITDSGNNIPDAILQKIFQPFYTTKGFGKGTGLGLSISKALIEDMGGKLYYDATQPNTSFVIELRASAQRRSQIAS